MNSKSAILYPTSGPGSNSDYMMRICMFNLETLKGSIADYKAQHPEMNIPHSATDKPPPSAPPPWNPQPAK
jgi:hypothetical protein